MTPELFEQVQQVLYVQRNAGTRDRKWDHYLKGLVHCARCNRRLTLERAKSKTDRYYFYFLCLGRANGECDLPRMAVDAVEDHVVTHWATVTISQSEADQIREGLSDALEAEGSVTEATRRELERELRRLETAENQCVDLIGHPDWPADKLTAKIRRLRDQCEAINARLADAHAQRLDQAGETVDLLLRLLCDPKRFYRDAADDVRRMLNRVCFSKLFLDRGDHGPTVKRTEHAETVRPLVRWVCDRRDTNGATPTDNATENGVQKHLVPDREPLVREGGLEPPRPLVGH